ncbi:MAG: hypothetical protein JSU70_04710 [Phycisphaerales bacterium]|nr:MAG: hypothetical protein JSU70_04710 [Phycisphaerales bacterium]
MAGAESWEASTEEFIGFDIDSKKTIVCVVQKGQKERFAASRDRPASHGGITLSLSVFLLVVDLSPCALLSTKIDPQMHNGEEMMCLDLQDP